MDLYSYFKEPMLVPQLILDNPLPLMVLLIIGIVTVLMHYLFVFSWIYQSIYQVQPGSSKHGGELAAEVFKKHGIEFIYTLVGGHISPILVASEKLGIRIIDTRIEATAVFAADATARLTGKVGVAIVTAGPGLTNTITAVKNAQMAESAVLVIGGAAATLSKGRGALQDIEQIAIFKPICKQCFSINKVREIGPKIRKALQVAQQGTPGPVFVEIPIDCLYKYSLIKKEMGVKDETKTWGAWIINWYLKNYLDELFAGAWVPRDYTPLPVTFPTASQKQVSSVADLVAGSRRPMFIIGSQAMIPPVKAANLAKAVEKLGIPCFLSGMARGLVGRKNRLQARQRRKDALQDCDLVILAGTVCDFRMSYGRVFSKKSKIVAVNRDKKQLYKNSDMFWTPNIALQADPASFIISLSETVTNTKIDKDWIDILQARDEEREEINRGKAEVKANMHLNPLKALHELEKVLDKDNAILIADGGDFVGTASYVLRPRAPLQWLDPGAFGTLGVGAGFALAAKLCCPDKEVWIIYGDGSLGYSLIEFDTYNRFKAPIIALVGNDACWGQIAREQVPMLGASTACMLEYTPYEKTVGAFNGIGMTLDAENINELQEKFKEASAINKDGKSVLINCYLGVSDFREGSISA